jgi:hypothetical protein
MLGSTPSEGAHKAFSGAHYCPDSATGLADLGCLTQALRSALADQKDSRAAAVCLEAFFVYEDPSQRKNLAIGAVAEVCGLCVQALGRDGGGAEVRCPPGPGTQRGRSAAQGRPSRDALGLAGPVVFPVASAVSTSWLGGYPPHTPEVPAARPSPPCS